MGICSVVDCERPSRTGGLCQTHATRMRRHGTTDPGKGAHGTAEERFWRNVDKGPGCWLWTGSKQVYGSFALGGRGSRRMLAHRYSYELHRGAIPEGLLVMHSCDTPLCVNPDHLTVGTALQNMLDMRAKGRNRHVQKPGEENGNAILNDEMVRIIRASTLPTGSLAKLLGVSEGAVRDVRKGRRWTHVT